MEFESRYLQDAELRVASGDKRRITGYAVVFDKESEVINEFGFRFREVIRRAAVEVPLAPGADIRALVDHEPRLLLGRTKAGTLRYEIDKRGVRIEIDVPDTSYGRDAVASIERGDTDGMSFRFAVASGGEQWDEEGDIPTRFVLQMTKLPEFSVVTFPAYPDTSAAVRSLDHYRKTQAGRLTLAQAAERIQAAEAALRSGPRATRNQ